MLSLPDYPVRQRDFLLEISRAITAQLDLEEVLKRVLHASVAMTVARVGLVALRDDDNFFTVRAFTGVQKEQVAVLNDKLQELIGAVNDGFDFEFLDNKLREMAETIDSSLVQFVAMPLIFAEKPLGLLIVFRSYQVRVTANDVQILQSFADQAAIAVHNAQLYAGIKQEQQRLAAILDYSGDGVMILDADLSILQVNRAFEFITAWRMEDVQGLRQDDVMAWQGGGNFDLAIGLKQVNPPRVDAPPPTLYTEGEIKRRDGGIVSIGITYAPIFHRDGRLMTVIANIRDITNFRKAQEMQNIFISTVSHELRTPVALIKGYASTLNREDARWDLDVIKQSLAVIEDEADRLAELIDDLLTASKIQTEQGVRLNLADVHLDVLAQRAVERFTTQTNRHRFSMSFQADFPSIQGDGKFLRQVVDNLLTNAIKYSPNGGLITVGGRYTDHKVTFFVRDEGAGISEAEQGRIFERFYRVDNNLTSKTKGTGLGLYLVKAIIEAHHGEINVKSQLSQGSTFYFTLPRD